MEKPEHHYKYKLIIAYDGTDYHGWQVQDNGLSIQEVLQKKMETILRHPIQLTGSGRTDAGVHALNQTAHFTTLLPIEKRKFLHSLNSLLPLDIRAKQIEQVPLDFHARYSAKGKAYHYHLHLGPVQNPFQRLYSLHVREKVDIERLKNAANCFLGTHDFTSFANEAHKGTASHDPVRTMTRLEPVLQEEGVRLEFEADGFLYKMVRNIVGVLLETATGKREVDEIANILEARDRRLAGMSAPPHGLFLARVDY